MAQSAIVFEGDVAAFERFTKADRMNGVLERQIRKAIIRASLYLVKEIKQRMRQRKYAENSQMTIQLAGGRKNVPLIKQKNLMDAISYMLRSSFEAEVGMMIASKSTGGVGKPGPIKVRKVVELMHTGYVITVTPKMRRAIFAALFRQKTKKGKLKAGAKGIKAGLELKGTRRTLTWRVPPRPFLLAVFNDEAVKKEVQRIFRVTIEDFWKEQGAKDGEHKSTGSGEGSSGTQGGG